MCVLIFSGISTRSIADREHSIRVSRLCPEAIRDATRPSVIRITVLPYSFAIQLVPLGKHMPEQQEPFRDRIVKTGKHLTAESTVSGREGSASQLDEAIHVSTPEAPIKEVIFPLKNKDPFSGFSPIKSGVGGPLALRVAPGLLCQASDMITEARKNGTPVFLKDNAGVASDSKPGASTNTILNASELQHVAESALEASALGSKDSRSARLIWNDSERILRQAQGQRLETCGRRLAEVLTEEARRLGKP